MNDPCGVRLTDRLADLQHDVQRTRQRKGAAFALGLNLAQSIWLASRSWSVILLTGTCCPWSAASALSDQWSVVLTISRWTNGFRPEAVKKLSMSAFWSL